MRTCMAVWNHGGVVGGITGDSYLVYFWNFEKILLYFIHVGQGHCLVDMK